jgi:hypothetical protein
MTTSKSALLGWLTRYASGLRFPTLLAIVAGLFVLDLFVPDLIPFADEVLLGLFTVLLATLRKSRRPRKQSADRVTLDVEPLPEKLDPPPNER